MSHKDFKQMHSPLNNLKKNLTIKIARRGTNSMLLTGTSVTKNFGGLLALKDVSFTLDDGEILGLIGPNGAGKTTLFNIISGFYDPTSGTIKFHETIITKLKPHQICRLGIGRSFQITNPFLNLSVLDNVVVGARFGRNKKTDLEEAKSAAPKYLEFVNLHQKKDALAKTLNIVERKKLEIARALAIDPKVILLDEPLNGLNLAEIKEACNLVKRIRDDLSISVFWIEHVMQAIMTTAERILVLDSGQKIAEGTPLEVSKDKKVITAYLGEEEV